MALISRSLSRGCKPIVGSSRTYNTPHNPLPSWLANRIRWASPPDSVLADRSSVRYSKPTSAKNCKRCVISRCSSPAIFISRRSNVQVFVSANSSPIGVRQMSAMVNDRNRACAASARTRAPPQVVQGTSARNRDSLIRKPIFEFDAISNAGNTPR